MRLKRHSSSCRVSRPNSRRAAADLSALTEAYVAVHYAQIPATDTQVRVMRAVWQRLRGQLKPSDDRRRKTKE